MNHLSLDTQFDDLDYEMDVNDFIDDQDYLKALQSANTRSEKRQSFATVDAESVAALRQRFQPENETLLCTLLEDELCLELFGSYLKLVSPHPTKESRLISLLKATYASDRPSLDFLVERITKLATEKLLHCEIEPETVTLLDMAVRRYSAQSKIGAVPLESKSSSTTTTEDAGTSCAGDTSCDTAAVPSAWGEETTTTAKQVVAAP
jgi:hypothetical protein